MAIIINQWWYQFLKYRIILKTLIMEVRLRVIIFLILGIIISESRCFRKEKTISYQDNYLAFISGYDTIYIDRNGFSISISSSTYGELRNKFIINLIDVRKLDMILLMNRPEILILNRGKLLAGKPINYYSSIPPPNVDFFFLLSEGSNSEININDNMEILCYIKVMKRGCFY